MKRKIAAAALIAAALGLAASTAVPASAHAQAGSSTPNVYYHS